MIDLELDLAELARERHAYAEADGRYSRALQSLAGGHANRRLVALRGRAQVRLRAGRVAEALTDFEAARALARSLPDVEAEIGLLLEHATALDWSNDAPASALLVDAASALLASSGKETRALRTALLVGQGRTLLREGRWVDACARLEQAVEAADGLGAPGYESLIVALLLLEVVLPGVGRAAEAEKVADRAVLLARAKGDQLNLASALNNRRNLLVARKDLSAAIADQRSFLEIGKQLGLALCEYYAEYNIAELHYQAGDVQAATPHALRALSFEASMPQVAPRPSAALLSARLLAFQGLVAEARALLGQVRAAVQKARDDHRPAGLLAASEEVLASMVDLSTREATDQEWDDLLARSAKESIEQEPIEVVEMRALSELRRGRKQEAATGFARALTMAAQMPNLLELRIRRRLATA